MKSTFWAVGATFGTCVGCRVDRGTFCEGAFNIEKKSSLFDAGATVGACVGGRVNPASKANKSANDNVGGFAGAIVGIFVVGIVVGERVGGIAAVGVLTGELLDPGSKSTT